MTAEKLSLGFQKNAFPEVLPVQSSATDWDSEYKKLTSIPSSRRIAPSKALESIIKQYGIAGQLAVDVGSGNGRNSAFLNNLGFEVTSVDFSKEAMTLAKSLFESRNKLDSFKPITSNILNGLPFETHTFDVAVDAYCTCHILDTQAYSETLNEISRVLKPGGRYFRIHLNDQDQYYTERNITTDRHGSVSLNIRNMIYKRHYSEKQLVHQMSMHFSRVEAEPVQFNDLVDGKVYTRNLTALMCSK